MRLYFGYGSNLDFDDWSKWCKKNNASPDGLSELKRAFLPGYSVNYSHYSSGRKGGAANIIATGNLSVGVYGVLFEVNQECQLSLDDKEGHPNHYHQIEVSVIGENGETISAVTYISTKYDLGSFFPPTDNYHQLVDSGLHRRRMPTRFIQAARENFDTSDSGYIIAYGTLKRGQSRERIMPGEYVCNGIVNGKLYDLGPFPGLVEGDMAVSCEVYFCDTMNSSIEYLDQIEGADLVPPLYEKKITPVECDDGKLRFGICYFYCGDTTDQDIIENGVWQ